jgi:SPP1 family predicted phage head-tail adaptor
MRIGDLRQRLRIERPQRAADGGGGAEESWEMVAEVWAAIAPLAGGERVEADAVVGRITHEVWLRFRADVTPGMRLRLGARLFDVRAAIDFEERRRFLKCMCEERDL